MMKDLPVRHSNATYDGMHLVLNEILFGPFCFSYIPKSLLHIKDGKYSCEYAAKT